MIHLAILSILIILITGFASLTLAFVVYLKEKNVLFRYHLTLMLLLTFLVIFTQGNYYFREFNFPQVAYWFRLSAVLIFCPMIARCILVEYPAKITFRYRLADRIFKASGILVGIAILISFFFYKEYFFLVRNIIGILWISGLAVNLFFILSEKNPVDCRKGIDWIRYTKIADFLYIFASLVIFLIMGQIRDAQTVSSLNFLLYPGAYFLLQLFSMVFLVHSLMNPLYQIKSAAVDPSALHHFGFSNREVEIAAKLVEGLSYRSIGQSLFISPETVKTHASNIYRKAGVSKCRDLVRLLQSGFSGEGK